MKTAQIVHNPTAGNAEHKKEDLIKLVKDAGFDTHYVSTDDNGWKDFLKNDFDIICLAGGDGTVHKLASVLLREEHSAKKKCPIYLIPLGTANNIAKTLQVPLHVTDKKISVSEEIKDFDCGKVWGLNDESFFLESVGAGIFPELIFEMKKNKIEDEEPAQKLNRTLQVLQKIVAGFEAQQVAITVDETAITGSFLMVEVMNIKYVGPNLKLAPNGDPGDGYFDLVMIPEENRQKLKNYLDARMKGKEGLVNVQDFARSVRGKRISITYQGSSVHIDDTLIHNYSGGEIKLEATQGALRFCRV